MSALVSTLFVLQSMNRGRVEIQERRRCSTASPYGNVRARRTVKSAAILANLAEWDV